MTSLIIDEPYRSFDNDIVCQRDHKKKNVRSCNDINEE